MRAGYPPYMAFPPITSNRPLAFNPRGLKPKAVFKSGVTTLSDPSLSSVLAGDKLKPQPGTEKRGLFPWSGIKPQARSVDELTLTKPLQPGWRGTAENKLPSLNTGAVGANGANRDNGNKGAEPEKPIQTKSGINLLGIGGKLNSIGKEMVYINAINSPTAKANRLKFTGGKKQPALIQERLQADKFQRGLALQKQINERNFAPNSGASASPSKLGTMGASTLPAPQKATGQPLGGTQFTGLQPLGSTPQAQEPRPPMQSAMNPQSSVYSYPRDNTSPEDAKTENAIIQPSPDDMEALNQFADAELGGLDYEQKVNGRKRGLRVMSGPYKDMTPQMAMNAVQNKFRGLDPVRKQQFATRNKGLAYRPAP